MALNFPLTIDNITLNSHNNSLQLKYVYHVLHLKYNWMLVQKLCRDNNCTISFDKSHVFVKDNLSEDVLLQASSWNSVYPIFSTTPLVKSLVALVSVSAPGPVWHRHLGRCGDRV